MSQLRKSRAKVPTPWAPRARDKGEAMPYAVDTRGTEYVSSRDNPPPVMRPGAMDAFRYQSRGF